MCSLQRIATFVGLLLIDLRQLCLWAACFVKLEEKISVVGPWFSGGQKLWMFFWSFLYFTIHNSLRCWALQMSQEVHKACFLTYKDENILPGSFGLCIVGYGNCVKMTFSLSLHSPGLCISS